MSRTLIQHLPPRFSEGKAREVEEIQKALQPELNDVNDYIQRIYIEGNLDDMTIYGIMRWEKILNITPPSYFNLNERRFTIKTVLLSQIPYTDFNVRQILDNLIGNDGYSLTRYLEAGDQILHIQLKIANKNLYDAIYDLLDRIVSAELLIVLSVDWNRWEDLRPYTWGSLSSKTWQQIKEEELQ